MAMYRLALDCGGELIRVGDKVEYHKRGEEDARLADLVGVFRSVHTPHEIHLNLSDRPYHCSVGVDELQLIHKVLPAETEGKE